ncbi:MAG: hypothetical protein ABW252_17540 [Polyangiales bacterium]
MSGASELELQRWSRGLRGATVVWVGVAGIGVVALALWLRGAGYYALPLGERVDHADYALLSPSRRTGMTYGVVGLGLMLLNLSYLLRRRFPHWPLGRMRLWLDAHVLTGFLAGLFVLFHSAFQLRSTVATVTASTLAITLLTGVVGRFFYAFVPRTESPLRARIDDLDALLPGVGAALAGTLTAPVEAPPPGAGLWRVLRALPGFARVARARGRFVHDVCRHRAGGLDPLSSRFVQPLLREVAQLAARAVYAVAARELLRAWRPWHRLCALIMVVGVLLHAGVALFYGYGWHVVAR